MGVRDGRRGVCEICLYVCVCVCMYVIEYLSHLGGREGKERAFDGYIRGQRWGGKLCLSVSVYV